eukprot:gb/GECG01005628.1/.p1 GENE.gb/GECG01005628.1/~~gb/GECG01005628.1/.p1  ORF type:complete len:782 (+),score=159.58 gb/GECG01005628.1/:1-2346(+)
MASNEAPNGDVQGGDHAPQTQDGQWDTPLSFITIDEETNRFVVHQDAVDYLNSLQGKIAVVSIAGIYRTGKSYLLNKMMDAPKGFQVGPTVKACTKGIWIWGKALETDDSDEHILFLDTEGLGSTNRSETYDCRIFALALLLSSYFIYNSFGTIDGNAIQRLSLVVNLTKYIHVKARQTDEDTGTEFSQFFPHFLWVVRDFSVKLERNGKKISAREYLEEALRPEDSSSESAEQKNAVRLLLRNFFPERDCITMVRPVNDEKQLARLADQPDEELRPEFRKQLEALKKRVFNTVRPKTMYGQPLNGAMLANLAQQYVAALNDNKTPTISTAWDRVIQTQCSEAVEAALRKYRDEMNERTRRDTGEYRIFEGKELRKVHAEVSATSRSVFHRNSVKDTERVATFEAQLSQKLEEEFIKFVDENFEASKRHCESLLQELIPQYKDTAEAKIKESSSQGSDSELLPFPSVSSVYQHAIKDLHHEYLERAHGPAKEHVLTSAVISRLPAEWLQQWSQRASDLSDAAFRASQRKLESVHSQLTASEGKVKSIEERLNHERETFEKSLHDANQRAAEKEEHLQGIIDNKSNEVERWSNKFDRLLESHKTAEDKIVQQLQQAKDEREDLTSQVRNLSDDVIENLKNRLDSSEKLAAVEEEKARVEKQLAEEQRKHNDLKHQAEVAEEKAKSSEVEAVRLREQTELLYENIRNQKDLLQTRNDEKDEAEYQWGAVKAKLAQTESDKLRLEEDIATLESLAATMKYKLKSLRKLDDIKLDGAEKKRLQEL